MLHALPGNSWLQLAVYFVVLSVCVVPLGGYMAKVYQGERTFLSPVFGWLERLIYRALGKRAIAEQSWTEYAIAAIVFSIGGFVLLYAILLVQGLLPFPAGIAAMTPDLAFNTAVSFVTNTNWQNYSGEASATYFTQMAGLTVQNFLSAAIGMAVLVALVRALTLKQSATIGNFWVDTVRSALYILLPLAFVYAIALAGMGVVQTFGPSLTAHTLEGTDQVISVGPVASQEAIKMLGTNGGGFFNANSAHPFENPTPFSDFLELLSILLIPAALCHTFGVMVKDKRQGFALLAAMTVVFVPLALFCISQEQGGNPHFAAMNIDQSASALQSGGNMEGKEVRFGIVNSGLWASATTAASNGSVNAMHDSFTPLGGGVPLLLMKFGEVIYGGVGCGLYGMLVFVVLTVFIAGLMVGRTPEYLGKKIQSFEMKMASIAIIFPPAFVLIGTAIAVMTPWGIAGISNPGAQGFTEVLYAFTSAVNNNGSAFAGLSGNTPFFNITLGICMLVGRYLVLIPVLAIAGSLATKKIVPTSAGTLPTHNALFITVLIGVILLVGVLTYMPTLALGPIVEFLNTPKG